MPAIVESLGPVASILWFVRNVPKIERSFKQWGPLRGNLICAIASLLNGCAYCTYAHARGFQLYYFEEHNELFPLDENEFLNLIPLSDDDVRSRLEDALSRGGLHQEVELFRRLYALKLEGVEATDEDAPLVHAIEMFNDLNACSIENQTPLDDVHDPVNRNVELKRRYAEARLEAQARRSAATDVVADHRDGPPHG